MSATEYTAREIKSFIDMMTGMYDLARVVDPVECRILEIDDEGNLSIKGICYNVWDAGQKCINCSSFIACKTGKHKEKTEHFRDQIFSIQSNPVSIRLLDGTLFEAVVELINVRSDVGSTAEQRGNEREAENVDHMADRYQAHHDPLTRLLNSGPFYELGRKKLEKEPDRSWVMITGDIMDFRLVNEIFGVEKGNEILIEAAQMLAGIAREADGLACRISADHFAMLLAEDRFCEDALVEAAGRISESLSSSAYSLHTHFGIYRIRDRSLPISVMCDRANVALRTIKKEVRQVTAEFTNEIMRSQLFEQEVISRFERILREGQFQMYLQPLIGEDGSPFGAEALVRWIRPDGTIVPPGHFVGILEKVGLISELDMYIWEQAIRQLSLWKGTEKESLTISVNMSALDIYHIDVYQVVTDLLNRYGVDSSKLRIELTETALIEDPEKGREVLRRLKEAGFYTEIDDFGKGNSSLSLLKDMNADMLKIDMEFIRETGNSARSTIILKAIIEMANSLGMDVIAEGVEREKQMIRLKDLGYRNFQGYYFSKPIPVKEFEDKYFPSVRKHR